MKTYHARIVGLCPALDGLRVEVVEPDHPLVVISSYVHQATVVRINGAPVHPGSLLLPVHHLSPVPEVAEDDLALDNPFGAVVETESWVSPDGHVVATRYVNALHINIRNTKTGRTLADQIIWAERGLKAWGRMQDMMAQGADPLDFLFELKEIANG